MRAAVLVLGMVIMGAGCSTGDPSVAAPSDLASSDPSLGAPSDLVTGVASSDLVTSEGLTLPPAPGVLSGATSAELLSDLDLVFGSIEAGVFESDELIALGSHGDLRVGWVLTDLLRFVTSREAAEDVAGVFEELTGIDLTEPEDISIWKSLSDHLFAWDVPAFDEYVTYKERLFGRVEPGWAPFFADPDSRIDWRFVSWGGVFIDDRELGSLLGCPRGCIPALDDPPVTGAGEGDWYPDDAIVFGAVVDGEARAYPKNMMEVHEMINDTLGNRRIGMPYCTLCGSAQLYFTDSVPDGVEIPVLRTSGLLTRSNKVMYDLVTSSVFDTFTGEALSGPLRDAGVTLDQGTVIASTWGAWREAHPETTILASDGGIGRVYSLDPLGGRDDDGPIFPVGDVDGRLAVQEPVIGVIAPDGTPLAFPLVAARVALDDGNVVQMHGVGLSLDGDGLRATDDDGAEVAAHQSFWFAWSQFHPDTEIWAGS